MSMRDKDDPIWDKSKEIRLGEEFPPLSKFVHNHIPTTVKVDCPACKAGIPLREYSREDERKRLKLIAEIKEFDLNTVSPPNLIKIKLLLNHIFKK